MKNILLAVAVSVGLGVGSTYAQDSQETKTSEDQVYNNDGVKTNAERRADQEDRSKAGEALRSTGSLIGSGAKAAGKGVVNAAEWTGENVADGASWTWQKAKHNKLTKNLFNQPGDE